MNEAFLIDQLARSAGRIRQLCLDVPDEQARWKPDPQSWSILEVVNHLYDEEREDFRVRLDIILHHPDQAWPSIDPEGWVGERLYNQRDLAESLAGFLQERQESLAWLRSLPAPDWQALCQAPWGDPMAAGDMFAAWVAHDHLHLRQLVELHLAYVALQARPFQVGYAGS
jgi:streptomycin 6-kinase